MIFLAENKKTFKKIFFLFAIITIQYIIADKLIMGEYIKKYSPIYTMSFFRKSSLKI